MSELIYCPECGHPKWDKDHFNCTYEPLVGEKAMTPDMKITFPPMIEGQTGWKVVGVDVGPELQLLVIDLGDSCVVKMEKGHWDSGTLVCRGGREDTVKVFYGCFRVLREAIEQKPVPRIERLDSKYLDGLLVIKSGGGEFEHYLSPEVFEGISQLAGKPLPIWEGGTWEELMGNCEHPSHEKINIPVWRYTR